MPSVDWLLKNYHHRWYPDETLDVAIGQGAVEATPIQLARIIGGIASDGHMVRPHVVFPDQLPEDFRRALQDTYPGSGKVDIPIDPDNWKIITDGMYEVTQPGLYHTASAEGLPGIDFAGKTGTAQLMSHQALDKTGKGKITYPNVWFVGVTPRRNPELVVAVLFQNGNKSWFAARIGAQVVAAYVEKQRRLAHNLAPTKTAADKPVEVGAVWTTPETGMKGTESAQTARLHTGHFLVYPGDAAKGEIEAQNLLTSPKHPVQADPSSHSMAAHPVPDAKQLGALLPEIPWKKR
jgi:penicillin-binding protein 2